MDIHTAGQIPSALFEAASEIALLDEAMLKANMEWETQKADLKNQVMKEFHGRSGK